MTPGSQRKLPLRELIFSGWFVIGIGLFAIGVSGALALVAGHVVSKDFVAKDEPEAGYSKSRCDDFFEYYPHAPSCSAAATDHHFDEMVSYRSAAGAIGIVLLAFYRVVKRRFKKTPSNALPPSFVPTVGTTLFGVPGTILTGIGILQIIFSSSDGAGGLLSGGIVSLVVAVLFAIPLVRALRLEP